MNSFVFVHRSLLSLFLSLRGSESASFIRLLILLDTVSKLRGHIIRVALGCCFLSDYMMVSVHIQMTRSLSLHVEVVI